MARNVVDQDKITLVPKMATFVVEGSNTRKYAVTLHPQEMCNCPATTTCYHIIAARMAVGNNEGTKKGKINLTELRRNVRKTKETKSGQKKPRKCDVVKEVIPAKDSAAGTSGKTSLDEVNLV